MTEGQKNEVKGLDLIKMIEAGQGASKVQWLHDVIASGRVKEDTKRKDDVIIDDIDGPINLDDIPF